MSHIASVGAEVLHDGATKYFPRCCLVRGMILSVLIMEFILLVQNFNRPDKHFYATFKTGKSKFSMDGKQ